MLNPQYPSFTSLMMLSDYEGPTHRIYGVRYDLLYRPPLINLYCGALILIFLASFGSFGSKPLNRTSTNTSLVRCSKVIEANLLSASAFLFWFLLTCLIVKVSKPFRTSFTFSKYCLIVGCLASKIPFNWLAIIYESVKLARLLISISRAICNPASNASYSASLFVVLNSKHIAYVYSLFQG
ncbi:hypothetical protein Tco_0576983 [Tanacetum coccineum]